MRAAQPLPTNNTSSKGRIRRDARTLGLSGVSRTLISRISIRDSNHADELRMVPQTAFVNTVTYGKNHKDTRTQRKAAINDSLMRPFFVSLCLCGSCRMRRNDVTL